MNHVEIYIYAADLERAKRFYTAIAEELGYNLYKVGKTTVTNCWSISRNIRLILLPTVDAERPKRRGGIKICLYANELDQVDRVYARAAELGAIALDEPHSPDACYRASFCDPEGNCIEIACGI